MSLNSKVAIVTGFETPIGRTVAGKLAEIGYLVAAQVPSYSEDIKGQNNITVFRADINDPGSVHDLVESCAEKLGDRKNICRVVALWIQLLKITTKRFPLMFLDQCTLYTFHCRGCSRKNREQ